MNNTRFWFDANNKSHLAYLVLSVLALNAAGWAFFSPQRADVVSLRKPIVIVDVVPAQDAIELGHPYRHTVHFEKTRDDCSDGRLVRHMWNATDGRFYKVEEIKSVQAPASNKVASISLDTPTNPLSAQDAHLMAPGSWLIRSTISYDCPVPGSNELRQRDTSYDTPVFEVVSGKGADE